MNSKLNTELKLFCPVKDCLHFQSANKKITKDGTYQTKNDSNPRQMFKCHAGNHRFSETRYSNIFGKHGSFKEYEQVAKLSSYSLSADAIADVLQKDIRTIIEWQKAIGHKSQRFHPFICITIGIVLTYLQLDELWSYVTKKSRQCWAFATLEVSAKFWVNFELGSRTNCTAKRLVNGFIKLATWDGKSTLKITTDKLSAYKNALEQLMESIPYVYLQIVKRRFKRKLITVKKCFIKGNEKDFPGKTQNTSFIERFNLTIRQRISYFRRKTLGYCKNKNNLEIVTWINLFNYNYVRYHKSLRESLGNPKKKFKRQYRQNTPAIKMGIANEPISWRELLVAPIPLTN